MSNIQWKEFRVGDLVEIKVGKQPPIGNRHDTKDEGFVNTITGVTVNNGVGFYSKPYSDIYINELTMAKDGEYAGKVYLQRDEFCLGGHSLGLLMGSDVSNDSKLYLATLLNGLQSKGQWQNSTYINSVTLKELKEILIPLPVTPEGTPDWTYMENYIREKQEQVKLRLDQLTSINETPKTLVYSALNRGGGVSSNIEWKRVILKDILGESQRGKRLKKADRVDGDIPLVTAGYINTGVAGFIGTTDGMTLFRNAITVDMFGNCFYREYAFYADDNILVISKEGLNKNHYIYLATLLGNETKNYDYTNQYRMKDYNKQTLMVPYIKKEDCPDWSYMDYYITEKQRLVKERLDALLKTGESEKVITKLQTNG